jgi:hypothetical protein
MIKCTVGNHEYQTAKLLFEDFVNLGSTLEEKVFPFFTCLTACIANNLSDAELLKALYTACKDVFNKEDMKFISNLVLNKDALLIDGKKLDQVEFNLHWNKVGYADYRVVILHFIRGNLGNFTSLSDLLPAGTTDKIKAQLQKKLLTLFTNLNEQLRK